MLGDIEKPELDDPENERLWWLMESYEEVAERVVARVASKGTADERY